jgi:phosphatidylserine/phosphatidylglycerophosphate/cardiolipin synthase-like enzyme
VQIRAMLWDQAISDQNTAEVKNINKLSNGGAILDNNTLSRDGPAFGTHHQKVLVVKGNQELIGFCGGIDIYPDRVLNPAVKGCEGHWTRDGGAPFHDVHCQIRGPAARDLLLTFIQRWYAHPDHQSIDITKGALRGMSEPVVPSAIGNHFVRIARTLNLVTPNRCIKARSVRSTTLAAIQAARKFIYIEDQYLVSMEAATALRNALPNIEHLTIVITHSDLLGLPQKWARRRAFIDLLQSSPLGHKVRVFFLATPEAPIPIFGPHTYVHSKIWVMDDELAIIGSANCNRRSWSHDSEANALIYEVAPPTGTGSLPFAQRLRVALWSRHLNVAPSLVTDGVASASLWSNPPIGAWIRPYDQNAGQDPYLETKGGELLWNQVDPSGDSLPDCPGGVETEVGKSSYLFYS